MKDGVDFVIGRRLRARRRLLGLSQQALGNACGVTFQQIHKYESAVCRLSANMLWKLAGALDVEMSYFFAGIPR
ncbi:MAG TPA: helix-turn-helix transcriptional regulator, partial [Phenylobacterium sp.]